jgi:hypothetical protein
MCLIQILKIINFAKKTPQTDKNAMKLEMKQQDQDRFDNIFEPL